MIIGKKHIKKLNLKKNDAYFLLAGSLAVITDFVIYIYFKNLINISLAKGFAFFCGIVVSWMINASLTFKDSEKNITKFFMYLFVLLNSMILNISVNNFFLYIFNNKLDVVLSFLIAISFSTIFNFIFFKYWVFKK